MAFNLTTPIFIQNASDFQRAIILGQTAESIVLDFKRDLDGFMGGGKNARSAQKELCKDISQFSNTYGGNLLLGIEEGRNGPQKVAAQIHSLDDFDGRRQWIEQAIQNFLVPSTFPIEIVPIRVANGLIISVNIPAYLRLVSVWDRDSKTVQCVRRTNHGKEYLNPDEIESHLMNSSRSCKLAFLRTKESTIGKAVQLVSGVWTVSTGGYIGSAPLIKMDATIELESVDEYEFQLCIKSPFLSRIDQVRIPYGLIQESWVTSERQIGLLLKVRLITSQAQNSLTMEPL